MGATGNRVTGVDLVRGFESPPLRHKFVVRNTSSKARRRPRRGAAFCVSGLLDGLGLSQHGLCEVVGQQSRVWLGQLGTDDPHDGLALGFVPLRQDVELGIERLVEAALVLLGGFGVDRRNVLGDL
jgi:hypothetical protein